MSIIVLISNHDAFTTQTKEISVVSPPTWLDRALDEIRIYYNYINEISYPTQQLNHCHITTKYYRILK
jgi:hypothetical protein